MGASEKFGRYRLVERLGEGGMAVVHRATLDGVSRPLVIKRMLPGLARDQQFVKGFLREGQVSSLLHHANIVQVFELGDVAGELFLAMELVDGPDLRSLIRHCRAAGAASP